MKVIGFNEYIVSFGTCLFKHELIAMSSSLLSAKGHARVSMYHINNLISFVSTFLFGGKCV